MRIAYDASSTLGPRTGIGRAALELLRAMVALERPGVTFGVLLNSLTKRPGPEHRFLKSPRVEAVRRRRPGPWLVGEWRRGEGPALDELVGLADVAIFPASYLAPRGAAPRLVVVHDLAFIEDGGDALGGGYFRDSFPRLLQGVELVATPSEFVRRGVMERYGLPADRVVAMPWGIDHESFKPAPPDECDVVRDRHAIRRPYILGVSAHLARKRNGLLLDAYARLARLHSDPPDLVVLGWGGRPPRELLDRPELHRRVNVLPHLPEADLAGLYTGALAVVVSTSNEGFGFPVLEALACGAPVLCGDHSALAEHGGEAPIRLATAEPEAWAEAVARLLEGEDERRARRDEGLRHVAGFTWRGCAEGYMGAIGGITARHRP